MKIQHLTRQQNRANWLNKPIKAAQYQQWLVDTGSLTARLKARYANFAVRPLRVRYDKAFADERTLIGLPARSHALVRDVLLMGNNVPVVFAHSVLPRAALRGAWNGLGRLGNKPLGATLFANVKVKRTPLQFKKLAPYHPLYRRALPHCVQKPRFLWARRSAFSLNCAHILVTEVFLPNLLTHHSR